MENLMSLSDNKKNVLINAGLTAFSRCGYRKCSVSDIASLAGVAKSMIFHYFGTKKNVYFYLIEFIRDTIVNEFKSTSIDAESDFFERIRLGTAVKVAVLKRYPHAVSFIKNFCFETDPEVVDDIKVWLAHGFNFSSSFALRDIDLEKFKPGIDPSLVVRMLHTYSEGFMAKAQHQPDLDIDEITAEFYQCLNMLRQNLYSEGFL
ncbi:MAG: TetR/AcrR family transcriptional regulator [Peptococcaceae bacterium]|nr:TetR/AcrR family transcriptional regulator [Peptococcaceae bacterium]